MKGKYNLRDSPFFRLRSREKLAQILFIGSNKLKELSEGANLYRAFKKRKKSGAFRNINAPRQDLKKTQKRIANLLQRITTPDYLFAPVSGRSYVDNASAHLGRRAVHLLDIDNFFPSCSSNKVIWFFKKTMECSDDVAVILKNIVTYENCLPQGSPCSPILAYLCYIDMWTQIEEAVQQKNCRLSVYADDITISGDAVPGQLVWEVKTILFKHRHRICKEKERSKIARPVEITGVIVTGNRLLVPNRQHKAIVDAKSKLALETKIEARKKIMNEIRGRTAQVNQIKHHTTKQITQV